MTCLIQRCLMISFWFTIAPVFGQQPGSPPQEPPPDVGAQDVNASLDLDEQVDQWLSEKELNRGWNQEKKMYVAVGSAQTYAKVGHRDFIASRLMAFDRAELRAKAEMTLWIGQELNSQRAFSTFEGIDELIEVAEELQKQNSMVEQNTTAVSSRMASRQILGLVAIKSFEKNHPSGEYSVRTLLAWSDQMRKTALAALSNGNLRVPAGQAKAVLDEQVPRDPEQLIPLVGIRRYRNELGQNCFVSFGQAQPNVISEAQTERARQIAFKKAHLDADRRFATLFETIDVDDSDFKQELSQSIKNAQTGEVLDTYHLSQSFRESVKAKAPTFKISGTASIRRWNAKHPVSGQEICGVVVAWNQGDVDLIKDLGLTNQIDLEAFMTTSTPSQQEKVAPPPPKEEKLLQSDDADLDDF